MNAREPRWITFELLIVLHEQQIERFGGAPGVRDEEGVHSALARPKNRYHYGGRDVDLPDLAAAYLYGIDRQQAFVDGNERTAVAAMLVFLTINEAPLHVPATELYGIAMGVARGDIADAEVAEWIRRNLSSAPDEPT